MNGLTTRGPGWRRRVFEGAVCAWAMAGLLSTTGRAGQARSVADAVYTAAQAERGRQIYTTQCAECHGNTLEGTSGPPLAGENFLSNWSARPLLGLVEKIQNTMPFNRPSSLSRAQSTELAAFILQAGKFPAGTNDLGDSALTQVTFPAVRTSPAPAAASLSGTSLPPPEGNLAELMRAIAFPNSNIIFNLQVKDPGKQPRKPVASVPFDYVEWGATVYGGWLAVDQAAVALTESAALLLTPGRKCQNGRPVPVDRADWKEYVVNLVQASKLAHQASKARNFEAFGEVAEKLNDACAACHKAYRDKGGTEGSGASRCQ
jgi:mono/diheme cytochrome c family protein